jgi:hypothetical protein
VDSPDIYTLSHSILSSVRIDTPHLFLEVLEFIVVLQFVGLLSQVIFTLSIFVISRAFYFSSISRSAEAVIMTSNL